ncbi:hypothetical protein [Pseudaeromonas paramecii]|uniref:BatD family protein n=1 Tax=Pseudaeromonas paramecii TaxID=2138166 RepID=A0ABP8QIS0_9GAMM
MSHPSRILSLTRHTCALLGLWWGLVLVAQAAAPAVSLNSWLSRANEEKPAMVTVNEPLVLHIDVATDRWFAAATQVDELAVANLLSPRQNLSAYNYAKAQQGQSWSHQRWDLPLFATKAGHYRLPALAVHIQVASDQGPQRVTLHTEPLEFDAQRPPLDDSQPWLVAPTAQLSQEWQLSQESLQVGDSIRRQISLQADDTLALLLPPLLTAPPDARYSAYPDPSQFDDGNDRGTLKARRQDQITYVLQQGGRLQLPPIRLQWWNSQTGQLETLTLAGRTLEVHHNLRSWLRAWGPWLLTLMGALVGLWWLRTPLKRWLRAQLARPGCALLGACRARAWPRCRQLIYQRLWQRQKLNSLLALDPSPAWQARVARLHSEEIDARTVLACWWAISRRRRDQQPEAAPPLFDPHPGDEVSHPSHQPKRTGA